MSDDMETGPDLPEEPLDETTAYAPLDEEPEEAGPPLSGRGKDERMWGMICHLAALAGFVGITLGNVLGPLIVWLIKREEFPLVADQGKESLNFQISMTIYGVICIPLMFVVIGFLLGLALLIADVVFIIIAAMKANEGALYRYPLTIRLIK